VWYVSPFWLNELSALITSVKYDILMASVMNTIAKYTLSAYALCRAGRKGENKCMWVFYIELVTGES
jgi:hypothetical protein